TNTCLVVKQGVQLDFGGNAPVIVAEGFEPVALLDQLFSLGKVVDAFIGWGGVHRPEGTTEAGEPSAVGRGLSAADGVGLCGHDGFLSLLFDYGAGPERTNRRDD